MSHQKTVILVTGANGNTGKAVAQHVLKRADKDNYIVRVGARSEDKVADLVKLGAHYVNLDFSDAQTLHAAVKGVDRVWATAPNPTKQQKENDRIHLVNNFIDAAKEAGVKYFLFGSVLGAQYEAVTFAREFRIAEKKLEATGIAYTHLRMAAFQENYLGQKDNLAKGFFAEPLGNGAYCPVSVEDVGIAAAELLLNPHPHLNKAYDLTGPKALSGVQIAHRLGKVVGHKVNYVNADPEQTYQFLAQFMAEYQAKGMLELYNLFSSGIAKTPSNDFTVITGRTGTRFYNRMKQLKAWGAL